MEVKSVADLMPEIEKDTEYSVITMDGKLHEKLKGVRTNYNVVFYNALDGLFYQIKTLCTKGEAVSLTVPYDDETEETADYIPSVLNFNARGYLNNGKFYHNGLEVLFERVDYDVE